MIAALSSASLSHGLNINIRRWAVLTAHPWLALCFVIAVLLLGFASPARADGTLQVRLTAPDEVRPLLEQHVRILKRKDLVLPEARGDRAALARRTRREVAGLLATEGYFNPTVKLDRQTSGQWVLEVDPGARATVSDVLIEFSGHLQGDGPELGARRDALSAAWSLPAGQPFRQSAWDSAKQGLLDGVARRDYAAARLLETRAEVDREAGLVRLVVKVDSGPPFLLGPIQVTGLERLPANLVPRLSTLKEGERFDQDRLLAFQSALQNAPQFAAVVIDIDRDPALAQAVPVKVHISEANSRHLSMGVGFSTNAGARTEINWRDVNLRGRGWELSTGLRIEQLRQSLYADLFLPPNRDQSRDSLGMLIDSSDFEGLETSIQALGVTRSRARGDIETNLTLRYQHETLRPSGLKASSRNALTLNWVWMQRKVDNLLDPQRGHILHFELGGGAKSLLSDQDFIRSYGRFAWYQPVGERDGLILRGELGATLANSRDGIPQDFLFRAGGSQSVRGYRFNSLGVREGNATLGGRYLATTTAEYIRWFDPQWGVAGFIDAGDAADDLDTFSARVGYGVGARWRSPAGPLALDLAWGHHDQRLRLHFAIAIAF